MGGCGSGGAHHGLHVIGGRYGLDLRQSQPTGTVSGVTLQGQRCAGIIYVCTNSWADYPGLSFRLQDLLIAFLLCRAALRACQLLVLT